jgi:hypothetical protein
MANLSHRCLDVGRIGEGIVIGQIGEPSGSDTREGAGNRKIGLRLCARAVIGGRVDLRDRSYLVR